MKKKTQSKTPKLVTTVALGDLKNILGGTFPHLKSEK